MHVVLVHPQIAPNTGNIIRLCANAGAHLHLVEPLGFRLDSKSLRRAGLDYHELAEVTRHATWGDLAQQTGPRSFGFSSEGQFGYDEISYQDDDWLVFGAERPGLPCDIRASFDRDHLLRIPMRPGNRSLNLANAVSIVVYEAWRQNGFAGAGRGGATTSETPGADFES